MIKPEELRIGNYYIDICGEVNQWEIGFFAYYKSLPLDGSNGYDKINPIPLTPKILEAAGFKEIKDGKRGIGVFMNSIYDFEETLLGSGVYSLAIYEEYTQTKIKYLHQFQNLYYTLTGQELTINLNAAV